MKVSELRDMLDNLRDDDELFFLLEQHRCNLQYSITGAGYDRDVADDGTPCAAYLVGREDGYGPSEIDEV